MKRLLLIVLPLLLIVGCSKPINEETLIEKGGLLYEVNGQKPYTGDVFELYKDGSRKSIGTLKGGRVNGLWTIWYENGQKKGEGTFKDGKKDEVHTGWYENGQNKQEGTFKDGKLISEKEWNEDGSVKE